MVRDTNETVTVVVPAWNASATLEAALASLAAQTRPADAVIVVDDASIDSTRAIADSWTDRLPLTVVTLDPNAGPAAARDRGIRVASTPLVALLDADDVLMPEHLATLLAARTATGAQIVSPNARFWDAARGCGEGTYRDLVAPPPADRQADDILRRDFVCTGALFERELYSRAGGFRAEFTGSEPWDLWIRMIGAGGRVHGVPEATVLYRVAAMSMSRSGAAFRSAPALFESVCRDLASEPARLAIAQATLQEVTARLELYLAYEAAGDGNARAARRHALAARRGPRGVRARAAALVCAPAFARRQRDRALRRRRDLAVVR
jgi:GT2 family glycosyltransferase